MTIESYYYRDMGIKLTIKQKKVLELIYDSLNTSGFPPTLADLKEKLGVASNQSVLNFLNTLEKKEYIKRSEDRQARGIKILPFGYREIGKDPLIKMAGISAGGSYVESFADAFTFLPIAEKVLENEKINESKDEVFVIQVSGDSMINAGIEDGDMLLIKKSKEYKNNDIVIARTENGTTVKKFIADGGKRYLQPENPAYERMIIIPGEVQFQGKVILNLSKINK